MTTEYIKKTAEEILKDGSAMNDYDAKFMASLIPVIADYEKSIGRHLPVGELVRIFRATIEYMGEMGY